MNLALIVAAGKGKRMGKEGGKQLLPLAGKPAIAHTLDSFQQASLIDSIIVVTVEDNTEKCLAIVEKYGILKVDRLVTGGEERQDSVYSGLKAATEFKEVKNIIIHDGARPLIEPGTIDETIKNMPGYDGVVVGIPAKDTIKLAHGGLVAETLNRSRTWQIQTPQSFRLDILLQAHEQAKNDKFYGTDDSMLVERIGGKVKVIPGSEENIKITTPIDLVVAEAILKSRSASQSL